MSIVEIKNKYVNKEIEKHDFINQAFEQHKSLFDYVKYISGTEIQEINITKSGCVFTTDNDIKFLCKNLDKRVSPIEAINFGNYELAETNLILSLMQDDFVFFDIGANIGWYTCNVAKKFPKTKIYSFEPIPQTFTDLENNVIINKFDNVSLYNIGLSNVNDSISFYYDKENSGCTSMQHTAQENVERVDVEVAKFDDFFADNSIKALDFIKCDVEGAELLVFEGGQKCIKEHLPIIFTEMLRKWSAKFDYHPNEIIELFKKLGYSCYDIGANGCSKVEEMTEQTVETNFVFLHDEKHADEIKKVTK